MRPRPSDGPRQSRQWKQRSWLNKRGKPSPADPRAIAGPNLSSTTTLPTIPTATTPTANDVATFETSRNRSGVSTLVYPEQLLSPAAKHRHSKAIDWVVIETATVTVTAECGLAGSVGAVVAAVDSVDDHGELIPCVCGRASSWKNVDWAYFQTANFWERFKL